MRCRCNHDISQCNPTGGNFAPDDLFGEYVYCHHDNQPCYASPYIEWCNYVASFSSEYPEADGCLNYEKWMTLHMGNNMNDKGHDKEGDK